MNIENSIYKQFFLDPTSNDIFEISEIDLSVAADENEWVGLSIIAKIPLEISVKLENIIDNSKYIFGDQFYYDKEDLHVTILEIITCQEKIIIPESEINKYISIIDSVISNKNKFILKFCGIIASKSCVVAKGYSIENSINNIRESLRIAFKNHQLYNTIDNRYVAFASHCTLVRFKNKLEQSSKYSHWMCELNDFDFGECEISELELRIGNWSLTKNKSKCVYRFNLPEQVNR